MRIKLTLFVSILALVLGAGPGVGYAQTAPGAGDDVAQDAPATNSNETSQEANDEATTEQENSVELGGSDEGDHGNNGSAAQGSEATTDSAAGNENGADQVEHAGPDRGRRQPDRCRLR